MKKTLLILLSFCLAICILTGGTTESNAAEKPKYRGTLTWNISKSPGAFGDPLQLFGGSHAVIRGTAQSLLNTSNTNIGELEPLLAESWEIDADKTYYLFKLKKGVKFHDGSDFNAQAVKWNYDRWIASPKSQLNKLTSVEIIDDYTIKCNLSTWDSVLLNDFARETFIISPTAYEKLGEDGIAYHMVGTGPFRQTKYKRNTYLEFEKFDGYWKKGLPYLDKVRITMIPDSMTASAAFKRKEVDALRGVDFQIANELIATGKYDVITNTGPQTVLAFNSKDPSSIWASKKARQALEYALDKDMITKALGRGYIIPVYEIVYGISDIEPGPGTTPRKYDPAKARQLFKEAGLIGTKVKIVYGNSQISRDIIAVLTEQFEEAGIILMPKATQNVVAMQKQMKPALPNELILCYQRGSIAEVLPSVKETFGAGATFFQGHKHPDGFDDLLIKTLQSEDQKEIVNYLYKMEQLAYEDALLVPLLRIFFITAQHRHVKDAVWYWSKKPYPILEKAWLDK